MGNGLKVATKTDNDYIRIPSEDEDSNDEEDEDEDDYEDEYEDEESSEEATNESFCESDHETAEIAIERQVVGVVSAEDKQDTEKLVQASKHLGKQTSETQLMNGMSQLKLKSMSLPMIARPSKSNNIHLKNTRKVTVSPNKFGKFKKKRKVSNLSKTKSVSLRSLLKESRNPKTQVAIEKERELRELRDMTRKSETIKSVENDSDIMLSLKDQLNTKKERTFQSTSELTGVPKLTRAKSYIAREYDQKRKAKIARQKKKLELNRKLETEQRRVKLKQNKVVKCMDIYRGHSVTKRVKPHSLTIQQKEWTF